MKRKYLTKTNKQKRKKIRLTKKNRKRGGWLPTGSFRRLTTAVGLPVKTLSQKFANEVATTYTKGALSGQNTSTNPVALYKGTTINKNNTGNNNVYSGSNKENYQKYNNVNSIPYHGNYAFANE